MTSVVQVPNVQLRARRGAGNFIVLIGWTRQPTLTTCPQQLVFGINMATNISVGVWHSDLVSLFSLVAASVSGSIIGVSMVARAVHTLPFTFSLEKVRCVSGGRCVYWHKMMKMT